MGGKQAVVTGAHGFVGRYAARHFAAQGWEVVGLGHGGWGESEWAAWGLKEWHPCEVTLDTLLTYGREPEAIIHCAGSGSVGFSLAHPVQDFNRTVRTTLEVLEYIRLHTPKARLVYPSSAGVYGVVETMPITEAAPLAPLSPYGMHKRMAEDLCRSYCRFFGVSATILRFFSLYGPELRKQLLWDACTKLRRREMLFPGTGEETRDWLHVRDGASLLFAAAEHAGTECPIVNGGSGEATTVREVLGEIVRGLGLETGARFSGATRPGDPKHYQAETARAVGWGWAPRTGWRAGIAEYVAWFKNLNA